MLAPASQGQLRSTRRLRRRKDRDQAGLFLAEGPQAVREALRYPDAVRLLLLTEHAAERLAGVLAEARAGGVEVRGVSERDLTTLTDAVTPQGVVAVCRRLDVTVPAVLTPTARLVVCCVQVRDPGNAGTVIRTADAFGAGGVLLSPGSVDLYNPKLVRASVGSLFHLPVAVEVPVAEATARARDLGLQVLAADGAGQVRLDRLAAAGELARPTLWLFGTEATGLPPELVRLADRTVAVPIFGAAESLNLSTAAAVCLYASATAQAAR